MGTNDNEVKLEYEIDSALAHVKNTYVPRESYRMILFAFSVAFLAISTFFTFASYSECTAECTLTDALVLGCIIGVVLAMIISIILFLSIALFYKTQKRSTMEALQSFRVNPPILFFVEPRMGSVFFAGKGYFAASNLIYQPFRSDFFNVIRFEYDNEMHSVKMTYHLYKIVKQLSFQLPPSIDNSAAANSVRCLNNKVRELK
ncbi:MAG: hypothetical protein GY847_10495 [Proteobacteria bacterium]|nr:hypothetical protein [Pseudomonadota bacterium]